MSILDPRTWLIAIGALAAAFVAGYITKGKHIKDEQAKAALVKIQADVKKHNDATTQLEAKKDERTQTYSRISSNARRIVADSGNGGTCFDADRMRVANEALGGVAAKPDKTMPPATSIK